jgi:hypothetical protein
VLILGYTEAHHEPWGDEVHSWNISKASDSYADLIHNSRYEGHPPTWYTVMWTISKFTHNFSAVQVVQASIAACVVFVLLFFSPFPLFVRAMMPFGYYFLYEYAVLSRNYAIGVLAAMCLCFIMRRSFRFKLPLYYLLLLIMSNTHLLALILAGCLHLYFLIYTVERKGSLKAAALHVVLGALIFLPAVYFIFPPADSQLKVQYWVERWNTENIKASGQAPLRSLIPVPAWWKHHSWNSQFLLDAENKSIVLNFFIALAVLAASFFILNENKKSLTVFTANFLLSMLIAITAFPLTSGRYAGYIFIGFVAAYWLYCYEANINRSGKWLLSGLLVIQVVAGVISVAKDIKYPFSHANRVNELIQQVPDNGNAVCDYWALNTIAAFADRPFYCVDLQKETSFLLWGPDMENMFRSPYRYTEGVKNYFQLRGVNRLYMISTGAPQVLTRVDPQLFKSFDVVLVHSIEGAIEKGGNLYLYKISSRDNGSR